MTTQINRRIAIIGGGASGALTALNLLRSGGAGGDKDGDIDVTVFEPSGRVGLGVAYATTDSNHLLNVRAGNMSAFPDAPGDLVEWAHASGIQLAATDFLPRRDYGRYLQDRLGQAGKDRPGQFHVVAARVCDIERIGDKYRVSVTPDAAAGVVAGAGQPPGASVGADTQETADTPETPDVPGAGGAAQAGDFDAVVLAYGNPPLRPLAVGGALLPQANWHLANPWDFARLAALPDDATIVLVGSGLTAVDLAISLLTGQPKRKVIMVSRNGLLPHAHLDGPPQTWDTTLPPTPFTAHELAQHIAAQAEAAAAQGIGWRAVVDGLRPKTQAVWQALAPKERQNFLNNYARTWEVRRHRMAPEVAAKIAAFRQAGQLQVLAGGISSISPDADADGGADPKGSTAGATVELAGGSVHADVIVNCTGPASDLTRGINPLVDALLARGYAAPDELGVGLSANAAGQVLAPDGKPTPGLYLIGPPLKGTLYESTAIPEIRVQAANLAARLSR